jgi:spoIIIJ-associated protein
MEDNQIDIKKVKKIAQGLLEKIDPEAKMEVSLQKEGAAAIEITAADPLALIGQNGETLQAIQHLLRVMARKVFGGPCFIDLDVNGYRRKRRDYLREMAISAANDAALSKKEITLAPMNSYERRIIHMELAERRDVATESRGCDSDRRIVIKPAE